MILGGVDGGHIIIIIRFIPTIITHSTDTIMEDITIVGTPTMIITMVTITVSAKRSPEPIIILILGQITA